MGKFRQNNNKISGIPMNKITISLEEQNLKITSDKGPQFSNLLFLLLTGKLNEKIIENCADEEVVLAMSYLNKIPLIRASEYGLR